MVLTAKVNMAMEADIDGDGQIEVVYCWNDSGVSNYIVIKDMDGVIVFSENLRSGG